MASEIWEQHKQSWLHFNSNLCLERNHKSKLSATDRYYDQLKALNFHIDLSNRQAIIHDVIK